MWLLLLTYTCLIIFIAGLSWRIYKYASLPVHLRWELYPVAHEIGGRAKLICWVNPRYS
jgi:nitrate reductase gamma subunit